MGQAFAGRGTMLGPLSTDWSSAGAGKSDTVTWRRTPGDSWAASVKADWPVRTPLAGCIWVEEIFEDFLATTTANENRQKIKQIRACLERKRTMRPLWCIWMEM